MRALRKRQVIGSYKAPADDTNHRKGAYWGIRADLADYHLDDALLAPHERTLALVATPPRLKRMDDTLQEQLVNWGYAVCDAALRKHVSDRLGPKPKFPYAVSI